MYIPRMTLVPLVLLSQFILFVMAAQKGGNCSYHCPRGTQCTCIDEDCQGFMCATIESSEENHVTSLEQDESWHGIAKCPSVDAQGHGPCVEQCRGDGDCGRRRSCCFNGCGHVCKQISLVPRSKLGSCPWYARGSQSCNVHCRADHECPGRNKCCLTSCGSVCAQPCFHWLRFPGSESRLQPWGLSRRCRRA